MASSYLLNLFGQSPIKPLQEHMSIVHSCVETLLPFFAAVSKGDWTGAKKYQNQIADLEREADEIKKNLRSHLHKSILMPVSRTDVLELLAAQDGIANKARDIAGLIVGRQMQFPQEINPYIEHLFQRSVDASLQVKKIIQELEDVFESGFRGSEVQAIQDMIKELDSIEESTDKIQIQIRDTLFSIEKNLPPIDVVFFYKVIEWTGGIADLAHRVGGRLIMLLAR
ncbi:MAG: TIGR00153 family protein [Gammaproteobacteria bacterium]